ncbi:hypothetical protein [Ralstonia chuxiongensis]|uniref:hypothetical protein n=1 Tax=Ralstonia chuxiongensis TaxID=2957504 RepID=UPI00292E7EE9|nr:hypothetical protein [Ralstonia chuxiongensis]
MGSVSEKKSPRGSAHAGFFAFLLHAHLYRCYRDPMPVLEREQEEGAAEAKREQACKVARMSLARHPCRIAVHQGRRLMFSPISMYIWWGVWLTAWNHPRRHWTLLCI